MTLARRTLVPPTIILGFSLVCTQIPLFNYLGFEFSGLSACVISLVSGYVALGVWKQLPGDGEVDVMRWFRMVGKRVAPLFLIPLSVLLLNALFVKNCSVSEGIVFYCVNVLPSMLLLVAIALFISVLFRRWTKTILAISFLLILLHIPLVTFLSPHIFVFNPLVGFFPGFTYDEGLHVLPRLLLYRSGTLAASATLLSVSILAVDVRRRRDSAGRKLSTRMLFAFIVGGSCLVYTSWMFFGSDAVGLSSSEGYLRDRLGGELRTRHFDIVYPSGVLDDSRVEELGQLHEFYYDKLARELGVEPKGVVTSFVYKSPGQKEVLFGAGLTDVTKPWRRQIHINLSDIPASLEHELVHIFAAEFGVTPLRIGTNPGLIEGLAVAVERTSFDETLSQAAALAITVGVSPRIESLFSFRGFMTSSPTVSYTLAGSFCRYLIDRFGMTRFKQVYGTGDFQRAYGQDLADLVGLWRDDLANVPISEGGRVKARFLFKRFSIFRKVCARVTANLNQKARELFAQRRFGDALIAAERSLRTNRSTEAIALQISARFRLKQYDTVVVLSRAYLSDSTLTDPLLPTRMQLADAYWSIDSIGAARREVRFLLSAHLSPAYDEACKVRLLVLKADTPDPLLRTAFVEDLSDSARVVLLDAVSRRTGSSLVIRSVARFMAGRANASLGKYDEALGELRSVGPLDDDWLTGMLHRRMGLVLFRLRDFAEARAQFAISERFARDEAFSLDSRERKEMCEWSMRGSTRDSTPRASRIH